MKKTIVGILSFVFLFIGAQGVYASVFWNTNATDCPGSGIGNFTTNTGIPQGGSNDCWNLKDVSAGAGDSVNVQLYYHNTGNQPASNTKVYISVSPALGQTASVHTFTSRIYSTEGELSLGVTRVTLTTPQALSFGSTYWYPNQTNTPTVSGSEIITSNGLSLGTINPGWPGQGSVTASFHVSNTVAPQTCNNSSATNNGQVGECIFAPQYKTYYITATAGPGGTISPAGTTSYTYPSGVAASFIITPSTGYHALDVLVDGRSVGPSYGGYFFYNIIADHTIHATFEKDVVVQPACVISSFDANPRIITSGGYSTLTWNTKDCSNVTISNLGYNVPTSSTGQPVYPTNTTTYVLTATGANGTQTREVTVTVSAPVIDTYTIDATASAGGTISSPGITTFTKGSVKYYYFNPSAGYHIADVLVDGVSIASSKTSGWYYFSNIIANHAIIVTFTADQVAARNCITTLTTNNSSITKGEFAILTWTLADCTGAELWPTIGTVSSSNSQKVYPTSSTIYTLTAYNLIGSGASSSTTPIIKNVTITVKDPAPQTCQEAGANNIGRPLPCTYDNNTNSGIIVNNSVVNSNNNNVVNSNNNNSVNNSNNTTNNITNAQAALICQDPLASNYLYYGVCIRSDYNRVRCLDRDANNYYEYGSCTYHNYNNNQTRCLDASATNYLSYNYCIYNNNNQTQCLDRTANNYLAYNYCIYGNQTQCLDRTASNYLAYNTCLYNNTVYVNKNVVTTVATNITTNQAQINGYITNPTFYNANVYFNYGTTVNLGSRTNSKVASGNSYFSDYISGLAPNTIYFFQAVGESNTGVAKGGIEVFRTLKDGNVAPIVVQGTTVIGTSSPVILNITNKYEVIGVGDVIDYVVTYKNVGKKTITRPMVQVMLPTNVTLINASRGTYSVDTKTLSAPLADLLAGEEGVIYIQAKVDSIPLNNAQIVTTAILVYTNGSNTQENVMAYVFNVPKAMVGMIGGTTEGSVLGASAFFAGLMSIGLIGWLLILLLILIIILIAKSYSRNNTSTDSKTITHITTH